MASETETEPERLIEEQMEKEHQLNQELNLLDKQVHQLEQELESSNDKVHSQEEENVDLRKQMNKNQQLLEALEEKLTEASNHNQELTYKLQEVEAIAKEDALVHDMIMKQHQEQFASLKEKQSVQNFNNDELIEQLN